MFRILTKHSVKILIACITGILLYTWGTIIQIDKETKTKPEKIDNVQLQPQQSDQKKIIVRSEKHRPPAFFPSIDEAHDYMEQVDLTVPQEIVIQYSNFTIDLPYFIDKTDQDLFLQSKLNRGNLLPTKLEQLIGKVEIIPDGTFQQPFDCGFKADYNHARIPRTPTVKYEYLAPIVVPHAFKFQHFYDGLLPKLIQAYPLMLKPEVKILIEKPQHSNIDAILDKLNFDKDKFVWYIPTPRNQPEPVYYAKYMIMTCITPPLHPHLWQAARKRLQIPQNLPTDKSKTHVMLLSRTGALKAGRNIINQPVVDKFLSERYGDQFVKFDDFSFTQAVEVFKSVRIIIGVHGGAFYNMNYAPKDATVIEIGPTLPNGRDIGLPHAIFWAMAELLGQQYWRLPSIVASGSSNIHVDMDKLKRILDVVDKQYV